jgi:hypothetical protein
MDHYSAIFLAGSEHRLCAEQSTPPAHGGNGCGALGYRRHQFAGRRAAARVGGQRAHLGGIVQDARHRFGIRDTNGRPAGKAGSRAPDSRQSGPAGGQPDADRSGTGCRHADRGACAGDVEPAPGGLYPTGVRNLVQAPQQVTGWLGHFFTHLSDTSDK